VVFRSDGVLHRHPWRRTERNKNEEGKTYLLWWNQGDVLPLTRDGLVLNELKSAILLRPSRPVLKNKPLEEASPLG